MVMQQRHKSPYVHSLDWVRALTILSVVAVHSIRFGLVPEYPKLGSLLQLLFQFGRVSFMIVTGFIIAYQYHDRRPQWLTFFQRRTKSALVPYLIWLAVFLSFSVPVWPAATFLRYFGRVLLTGNGHLYYLIITFQMYLLAPVLIFILRRVEKYMVWFGAVAMAWELFSWTMASYGHQGGWAAPLWVSTYVGYFVLGGVIGFSWNKVRLWLNAHRAIVALGLPALWVVLTATFLADLHWVGGLASATSMFQPVSALYGVALTMTLLASGAWFEEARSHSKSLDSIIGIVADASFGIYLIHPIFVHGWLNMVGVLGWGLNPVMNTAIAFIVGAGFSVAGVFLIRHLPFSEYVIGTKRRQRKTPKSVLISVAS